MSLVVVPRGLIQHLISHEGQGRAALRPWVECVAALVVSLITLLICSRPVYEWYLRARTHNDRMIRAREESERLGVERSRLASQSTSLRDETLMASITESHAGEVPDTLQFLRNEVTRAGISLVVLTRVPSAQYLEGHGPEAYTLTVRGGYNEIVGFLSASLTGLSGSVARSVTMRSFDSKEQSHTVEAEVMFVCE